MKSRALHAGLLVLLLVASSAVIASASELEVFFGPTKPDDPNGLHAQTIRVIQSARQRLNAAVHELRLQAIADAFIAAHRKGVKVRLIGDDDYYDNDFMKQLRAAGIETKSDSNKAAIMHHKYVVADGERMTTGSYNLTDSCSFNNNNNLLVISNKEVCKLYDDEFESLWAGHMYGTNDGVVHTVNMKVDGRTVPVEVFFQPRFQGTQDKVLELLSGADQSLYMAQFAFYSGKVASALAAKLEEKKDVKAVIDYSMVFGELQPFNQIGTLAEKAVPFCIGDNPGGKMHHKLFVIDPDGSDPTVVTGSANASSSGYKGNVENIIVIHDKAIAQKYRDEVERLFLRRDAGTVITKPRGLNGIGKEHTLTVTVDAGGSPMKKVEISLPFWWKIDSVANASAYRGDLSHPVQLRLEERAPSHHTTEKVQMLVADDAGLAGTGAEAVLTVQINGLRMTPGIKTGKYCLYVRGSDARGALKALPNLPIVWLFRSSAENVALMKSLLESNDVQASKDLEYLMRDLSSGLYDDIDYGKLGAVKDLVVVLEQAQQAHNPRLSIVTNTARLICQRLETSLNGETTGEGAGLAERLKTVLKAEGVVVKPPKPPQPGTDPAVPAGPEALKADMVASLVRYHNLDGQGNGSQTQGVQLCPGVADKAKQEQANDKLCAWLSTRKEIVYRPSPTDQAARAAHRRKIAEECRESVSTNVKERVVAAVGLISDARLQDACRKALDAAPPEFYTAPSSSSGKHHPADEINPGGLALHSVRDVVFGMLLCDYYKVSGKARDEILAGLLLHDIKKGGDPWKDYDAAHGPLGARWLGDLWKDDKDASQAKVRELVSNHMAQWNAPKPTPPADLANQIASYADYLGSQDGVYVAVPR